MLLIEPREHFDKCIIGVLYDQDKVVYDADQVIETFMRINDWDEETAIEWFEYNTIRSCAYYENAPLFMSSEFDLDNFDIEEGDEEAEDEEGDEDE